MLERMFNPNAATSSTRARTGIPWPRASKPSAFEKWPSWLRVLGSRTYSLHGVLNRGARAAILLVTASPLVVVPGVLFPYVVGKVTWARVCTEVALGLWLLLLVARGGAPRAGTLSRWPPGGSWVLVAFGVWLGVSVVCGLAGVGPGRSLWSTYERMQGLVGLAHGFAFVVVSALVLRGPGDWRLLFGCSLATGTAICMWGLATSHGLLDLSGAEGPRLSAGFGNPTYLGGYLAVNALLGVGLLWEHPLAGRSVEDARGRSPRRRAWLRAVVVGGIALHVWALWLTAARGALVSLVVGAAVLLAMLPRMGGLGRVALASLLLVGLGVGAGVVTGTADPVMEPDSMPARLIGIGLPEDTSAKRRLAALGVGLRGFAERPWLGWGPENFVVVWGRFAQPGFGLGEHFDHAHNKLVEELATKGLLGFAAYVSLWVALVGAVGRALTRGDGGRRALALAAGAGLVAHFVQNLFLLDTPTGTMQFAMLAAFAASAERREDSGVASGRKGDGQLGRTRLVTLIAVVVLTAATCYAVAYRPFAAARMAAGALAGAPPAAASLRGIVRAVDAFPPLGNYLRLRLFAAVDLAALATEDPSPVLELLEEQGTAAGRSEPCNWRVPAALAFAYETAAPGDGAHVTAVEAHLKRLRTLAPGLVPAEAASGDASVVRE